MRAVSGRQLLEEGVIHEACAWEDYEDEFDEADSVVDDRESVISTQTLSALQSGFPSVFNNVMNSATPQLESVVTFAFNGLFDSGDAVPLTEDCGVLKKTLVSGTGVQVSEKDIVSYHYSAFFDKQQDDRPFATSYQQRFPLRYRIGVGVGVTLPCVGIDIALRSMRNGETAVFLTSPDYGYGRVGLHKVGGSVPSNAHLLWKIQVFEVVHASACDDLLMLTSAEERHQVPFEKLHGAAAEEKDKGTQCYHRGEYILAKRSYRRALRLMQESIPRDSSDEERMIALTQKLLRNLAQVSMKLKNNIDCCRFADEALELDDKDYIALRKKLTALINLGQFDSAKKCLVRCEQLCPPELKQKLEEERRRFNEENTRYKENKKNLEQAMAKGLFSSHKSDSKPPVIASPKVEHVVEIDGVPSGFQTEIIHELDDLSTSKNIRTPKSLNYELKDLTEAEVEFIKREASKRELSCNKVDAEIGRTVLIVQIKRE